MAIKKIISAGHPALKKRNQRIIDFSLISLKNLIQNLTDTMHDADLIGIAAPQIGVNASVFITEPRNTKSRKLGKTDKMRVYINPKIIAVSKKKNIIYEGCGSLSGIFGPVSRPTEIEIEAYDQRGKKFRLRCDGILARVIQHELDHLSGVEFIAKVADYRKIITAEHYRKNIKNSKLQKINSLNKIIQLTVE